MNYKKLKFSFSLLFSFFSVYSQVEWNSKKDKIVIPFELSNNLIIIDVKINNVKLSMLLDTGSDKNLLFSFPENDSIEFFNTKKIKINGFGKGEYVEGYISENNIFEIKGIKDNNFELLLLTEGEINLISKLGIPINGIVGYSFFKNFIVEVNYQNKKIILYKNFDDLSKKKVIPYEKKKIKLINDKPYINLNLKLQNYNDEVKLLMDTGLSDGLWLFENDSINCSNTFYVDVLGTGLGGDVIGKKSRIKRLSISNFILNDALVAYPDEEAYSQLNIIKGRNGSLGGEIFKRFNWIFDYINEDVYFRPNKYFNDKFNYNMSGIEIMHGLVQWIIKDTKSFISTNNNNFNENNFNNVKFNYKYELKPIFEIYSVRKDSPADKAGLKEGDLIVSINNRKAYNYTIQKITDLFQSEEGKKITIEVERDGKILKFKFQLEKIL